MTFGSLFSGIGGMDLGLERAGMECKWQVENDEYCLKVLTKHWPDIPKFKSIKTVDFATMEPVDLLAGGFPCQDLSLAGKQAGLKEGTRSGLWFEFLRGIRTLRPRFVLVENVPGLLTHHAMGRVLGDLAECGYDAEWQVLSAAAFGALHLRKRVWIVAYRSEYRCGSGREGRFDSSGEGQSQQSFQDVAHSTRVESDGRGLGIVGEETPRRESLDSAIGASRKDVSNSDRGRLQKCPQQHGKSAHLAAHRDTCGEHLDGFCDSVPHTISRYGDTRPERIGREAGANPCRCGQGATVANASSNEERRTWSASGKQQVEVRGQSPQSREICNATSPRLQSGTARKIFRPEAVKEFKRSNWWATEPDVGRVAHGIPFRVDRLKGLGNACVPECVEWIGTLIRFFNERLATSDCS